MLERFVGRDGVIAGPSGAQTQRQVLEDARLLEPRLIGQVPLDGARGEESPFVVGGEVGRGVCAAREGDVVALLVVVVDTAQEGDLPHHLVVGGDVVVVLVADGVEVVPLEVVHQHSLAVDLLPVGSLVVHRHAGHRVEVVDALEVSLVGDRVVGVELCQVGVLPVDLSARPGQFPDGQRAGEEAVQVRVILIICVPAPDRQALDGRERERDRLRVGEALPLMNRLLDGDVGVVERGALSVVVQVVHLAVDAQDRGDVDRARPYAGTADAGLVIVVAAVQHVGAVVDLEPFVETVPEVEAPDDALRAGVQDDAFVVGIGDRGEIVGPLAVAADGEGVFLEGGRPGNGLEPVGPFAEGGRVGVFLRVARSHGIDHAGARLGEVDAVVVVGRKLGGIHIVKVPGEVREAQLEGRRHICLAHRGGSRLGGDDDDAVGALRAVDGR